MSQSEEGTQTGPPQPEQVVAAATTQTGPGQETARHMRTTDCLRTGEGPPQGIGSEARVIEEALVRLGRDASPADVQRELERVGFRVGLQRIREVQASSHPAPVPPAPAGSLVLTEGERVPSPRSPARGEQAPPAAPPAPADPADLVRTEAERVPPPDRRRP